MELTDLPDCMLKQIFEHLSYDEIAKNRIICKRIDTVCQDLLNVGFTKVVRRHSHLMKMVKAQLPRRESERRNHPLEKHSNILTCIETRISILSMTYSKYIEMNLCCFIPGKVIDEVTHILDSITNIKSGEGVFKETDRPLRAHEVLQELRDISSMAIDHFDEKISPALKIALNERPFLKSSTLSQSHFSDSTPCLSLSLSALSAPLHQTSSLFTSTPQQRNMSLSIDPYRLAYIRLERKHKSAMRKLNQVVGVQKRQAQKIRSNSNQINELNAQISDLRRRLDEPNDSKETLEKIATAASERDMSTMTFRMKPSTSLKPTLKPPTRKRQLEHDIEILETIKKEKREVDCDWLQMDEWLASKSN